MGLLGVSCADCKQHHPAAQRLLPGAPAWQTPASLLLTTLSWVRAESEGGSLGFLIQKTSTEILQELSISRAYTKHHLALAVTVDLGGCDLIFVCGRRNQGFQVLLWPTSPTLRAQTGLPGGPCRTDHFIIIIIFGGAGSVLLHLGFLGW